MSDEYTPYRIMKSFVVSGPNEVYLMANFPGGEIKQVGKKRGWQSIYKFKAVVNSPTPAEIRFFNATKHARLIPQAPGGYDKRESGIARSIKSSVTGRQEHKVVVAKRKFAAEEAKRKVEIESKPKLELKPETIPIVVKPELELKPKPKPNLKPKIEAKPHPSDSDVFVRKERGDKIESPIKLSSEVKITKPTIEEEKKFSDGEIIFGPKKKKRGRRKKIKKSDSFPSNKPDDRFPDNASKKAGQKITEERNNE